MNDYIKCMVIGIVIDSMDTIREYLHSEALKTDNKLDDAMVDTLCDWATDFLEGLR